MSEKSEKGSRAKNVSELSKADRKAYHADIREFYLQNGWRETLSSFSLSPTQGSEIIPDRMRAERKKIEKEAKKATRAEEKLNRKKAKAKAKESDIEASANAAPKKRGRKPKMSTDDASPNPSSAAASRGKKRKPNPEDAEGALDFLLQYRQASGPVSLDEAIVNLALIARS